MSEFSFDDLQDIIATRSRAHDGSSYTANLIEAGTSRVAKKLGEEAVEVVIAALEGDKAALVCESADLLYHLQVLWHIAEITPHDVLCELGRRTKQSGLEEKAARTAQ